MAFYAVSTQEGKETTVASDISNSGNPHIHAVLAPATLNSYIIVEADGETPVQNAIADVYGATKVLPGMTSFEEVQSFLSPSSRVEGVAEGDIIEVTDGPYAGQTARVEHINHEEEQVKVELHEETIPLSVSLPGDQIRAPSS